MFSDFGVMWEVEAKYFTEELGQYMLHWHSASHIVYGMREKDSEEEVSNKQAGLMEV